VVNNGGRIVMSGSGGASKDANEFIGSTPTAVTTINSGGLILDTIGVSNPLGNLNLAGGTLQTLVGNTAGNWSLTGTVSTPGDGSTSYITGGSVQLLG